VGGIPDGLEVGLQFHGRGKLENIAKLEDKFIGMV
jgi:hypothetical protein